MFLNRLGETRDRSSENQRYRAGGLNLGTEAIVLWNTVYLGRAVQAIKEQRDKKQRGRDAGQADEAGIFDESLLQDLSLLGWEHINLTGDYVWRQSRKVEKGKYRPPRLMTTA